MQLHRDTNLRIQANLQSLLQEEEQPNKIQVLDHLFDSLNNQKQQGKLNLDVLKVA